MPVYEYECSACKHRFERSQRFSDPPISECPECGSPVRRLLFPAGVVFKGSGWYITDSRKPAASESSPSTSSSSEKSEAAGSKTETKSEGGTGGSSKSGSSKSESSATTSAAKSS
jgi:putative FmdB family regulatory protein